MKQPVVPDVPSTLEVAHLTTAEMSAWPGGYIREPRRSSATYLVYEPLARLITTAVAETFAGRTDLAVLDVGCGTKPWLPLLAARAASYRGLDATPGPYVDDVGDGAAMPYPDNSFDLVICTQVLEHVLDPDGVVRELARVTSPGGLVLASTHGVFFYHPEPANQVGDYWRWTHAGLAELFSRNASWEEIDVAPNRDMVACVAMLFCVLVRAVTRRRGLRRAGTAAIAAINLVAETIDDHFPAHARVPGQGSLSANYLVVGRKAGPEPMAGVQH